MTNRPADTLDLDTPLGPFRVHAEGTITRALLAGQWWDAHLKPAIDRVQGGWAVDIGAHCGWFTRYLAQRHPFVFACEPWPASFELLQYNTGVQRGVHSWPVAAYATTTALRFAQRNDPSDPGSWGFNPHDAGQAVAAVCLDDYLPPVAPIALIKCDAQGADLQALQGLARTIRRARPLILFEWEATLAQDQGSTWEDYLRFFHNLDYTVPARITTDYWDYVVRPA